MKWPPPATCESGSQLCDQQQGPIIATPVVGERNNHMQEFENLLKMSVYLLTGRIVKNN